MKQNPPKQQKKDKIQLDEIKEEFRFTIADE